MHGCVEALMRQTLSRFHASTYKKRASSAESRHNHLSAFQEMLYEMRGACVFGAGVYIIVALFLYAHVFVEGENVLRK
jgi:hypothetical protein